MKRWQMPEWLHALSTDRVLPFWQQIIEQVRLLTRPRSLAFHMALGAIFTTTLAIIAVIIISSITISGAFSGYLQGQLRESAGTEADRIGLFYALNGKDLNDAVERSLLVKVNERHQGQNSEQVWIMDTYGNLVAPPFFATDDENQIIPALHQAITTGQGNQGPLKDFDNQWLHYSARAFAIEPIFDQRSPRHVIIGAVAVSSQRSLGGGGPGFIRGVDRRLLISGAVIALIAVIGASFLARRITRNLAQLSLVAGRIRDGDLTARVAVDPNETSLEVEQMAFTFNVMADKIERDVTELHRQERLKRELVSNVAHELATPLTSIQGFSEALKDGMVADPRRQHEFAQIIHEETLRLKGLVDQLRQMTRLESGIEQLVFVPLSMETIIQQVRDVLRMEIEKEQLHLALELPRELPAIAGDADKLKQVLINLIDNARRHSPTGGTITVAAQHAQDMLRVEVRDQGPGIPEAELENIFERFYRADTSRTRETGGSGLGLAIVRDIVAAHGGSVWATNNPGGGACVSFALPTIADATEDVHDLTALTTQR